MIDLKIEFAKVRTDKEFLTAYYAFNPEQNAFNPNAGRIEQHLWIAAKSGWDAHKEFIKNQEKNK